MARKIKLGWNQGDSPQHTGRFSYNGYGIYWKKVDGDMRTYIICPSGTEYYAYTDIALHFVKQCIDGKYKINWRSEKRQRQTRNRNWNNTSLYEII